jgi:hypothetical protein
LCLTLFWIGKGTYNRTCRSELVDQVPQANNELVPAAVVINEDNAGDLPVIAEDVDDLPIAAPRLWMKNNVWSMPIIAIETLVV